MCVPANSKLSVARTGTSPVAETMIARSLPRGTATLRGFPGWNSVTTCPLWAVTMRFVALGHSAVVERRMQRWNQVCTWCGNPFASASAQRTTRPP